MLRWLSRLWARRDLDGYTQSERNLYCYFDGTRMRRADPLLIQRRLAGIADLDWEADCSAARWGQQPAKERLEAAVMHAFGVADYEDLRGGDSRGLTRDEMLELLNDFGNYLDQLKKKRPTWPPMWRSSATPG